MRNVSSHTICGLLALAACAAGGVPVVYAQEEYAGLSGKNLLEAVGKRCVPAHQILSYSGDGGKWHWMELADGEDGCFLNRFGSETIAFGLIADHLPAGAVLVPVVPAGWFISGSAAAMQTVHDLYNLLPAPLEMQVERRKGAFPPGIIVTPEFYNGVWGVGKGTFAGSDRYMWQPPAGSLGATARIVMYMIAGGKEDLMGWDCSYTRNYLERAYPFFTAEAARQLMAWHRSEPVSEIEHRRNDVFEQAQGNRNPFVDYPDLAEYCWGSHKGEVYESGKTPGVMPDDSPLRARYRLSDTRINLRGPGIPEHASWTVDGVPVSSPYLVPSELGKGVHELRFSTVSVRGKVKIRITD